MWNKCFVLAARFLATCVFSLLIANGWATRRTIHAFNPNGTDGANPYGDQHLLENASAEND